MHSNLIQTNLTAYLRQSMCRLSFIYCECTLLVTLFLVIKSCIQPPATEAFSSNYRQPQRSQSLTLNSRSSALRGSAGLGEGRYRTEWGPRLKAVLSNLSDHVIFYNTILIRDKSCEQFTFSSVRHFAFYTPLYSTENKMKLVVTLETDFITCYRIMTYSVKTLFQRMVYESKSSRL